VRQAGGAAVVICCAKFNVTLPALRRGAARWRALLPALRRATLGKKPVFSEKTGF
jgi:hypothetical protein